MKADLQWDYTTVGHVTVDVFPDGSRRAGGAAFYSALQAARLGMRALILTRGVAGEIEELLAPYAHELELRVLAGEHTTTLHTSGTGSARSQRVLAWGGPIEEDLEIDSAILHLAPVACETPSRWRGHSPFVGLTPQGLLRQWPGEDRRIVLSAPPPTGELVADSCHAIVVSQHERTSCATLIARALSTGASVAVTHGAAPNTVLLPDGRTLTLDVPRIEAPLDDLGAGDVFAAAFFTALADGRPPAHAAGFATAAAAVRIQGHGADAIGRREEIDARLRAVGSSLA
jgi:sugar/nucleoside kinase (ribokinase family)